MIEILPETKDENLGFCMSGKIHDEDYKLFVPAVEDAIKKHGKVCLLAEFKDFHGWDLHAVWDDMKFGAKHCLDVDKIALVGDKSWEKWMAVLCKPFTLAKVKYFDREELEKAWEWLKFKKVEECKLRVEIDQKNKIAILEPHGGLTATDFKNATIIIDALIEKEGSLNGLIIHTENFPGWASFGGLMSHLKFIKDHHKKVKSIAFVTDSVLGPIADKIGGHFVSAEVKDFKYKNLDDAKEWILENK